MNNIITSINIKNNKNFDVAFLNFIQNKLLEKNLIILLEEKNNLIYNNEDKDNILKELNNILLAYKKTINK